MGSPEAPVAAAVRRYLKEFLSDPRVVELPRALWLPLLHGIVLNVRPKASARKYARIWGNDGSPLLVHTRAQAARLGEALAGRTGSPVQVEAAMRYGEPAIAGALARLKALGCERILVLPLYPQYAASTTASAVDEVARYLRATRDIPEVRLVKHFHDHPAYLAALAASVREHWKANGRGERLLMSFHGLPRSMIERGDPYYGECQQTARLLADSLDLDEDQWTISFQSRFGRRKWLEPATAATLAAWGGQGLKRVDVLCPGFVSDCLETLEEIGIGAKETFLGAGGGQFRLIACLNEREDWIAALAMIALGHLSGWVSASADGEHGGADPGRVQAAAP
ncbi:MAG: ferrochelatase [Betaproteobacteria bacterium]|nr:ferrochelatase [Betaproteobacteria bacterium]